jgi:hypothetical protein
MNRQGSASVYALLGISVLMIASVGAAGLALGTIGRAQRDARAAIAFNAAQAGLEYEIAQTLGRLQNGEQLQNTTTDISAVLAPIATGCTARAVVQPIGTSGTAWITSTTTFSGKTKSVRTLIRAKDLGIWNNAIFAGTGASGRAINGNVDVRGSVHILGDGEEYTDLNHNGQWDSAEAYTDHNRNGVWDPGEPFIDRNDDGVWTNQEPYNDTNGNGIYDDPIAQTELNSAFSGTAYIGNNYAGIDATLKSMVPAVPTVNGVNTLNGEVRVKRGMISIQGSASIGSGVQSSVDKMTMDGVFVSDGFTGSRGADGVFSDNGTTNAYDVANLGIEFPEISGIGADRYTDDDGAIWSTQDEFLQARSLTIPVRTITAATESFRYGPDAHGNSITFTRGNPSVLDIRGIIRIDGTLQLGDKDTIRFTGNGTFFTEQDIRVDGNFLPANGFTFPTTARVGFLAKRNIALATGNGSSQLDLAGAFYAQGAIQSAKQNEILGSFVANYFDLGTNVPKIYQVPSLPQNMPPGMPGNKALVTLKLKSWRERR